MSMIPEAMRLPFTFGLSGALHMAALSSVLVPPVVISTSTAPLQVRLMTEHAVQIPVTELARDRESVTRDTSAPISRRQRDKHFATIARSSPGWVSTPPITAQRALPPEEPPKKTISVEANAEASRFEMEGEPAHHSDFTSDPVPRLLGVTSAGKTAKVIDGQGLQGPFDSNSPTPVGELEGTVDSPFKAPKALHSPLRKYPEEARWERRTGRATLIFQVEADGSVGKDIRVLHSSGHPDLDATARDSLRHWRFDNPPGAKPAFWYHYVFRFELT